MRNSIFILFLTITLSAALPTNDVFAQQAQEKPLAQAEFVRMLYDLQKNPAKRDALVETIRKRGIGFELTSGVRSLVMSKSGDAALQRTLEEAARRRANPAEAVLPSAKESGELLTKARAATLAAVDEMPDFVVKQLVSRSYAYAKTNNFRSADRLTIAVSYSADKGEEYKVLAINGIPQTEDKSNYNPRSLGGTTSAGEFVTVLATIFKPESKTEFEVADTDTLRNRRCIVYSFNFKRDDAPQRITSYGFVEASTTAGAAGKIWIDRETGRVLRVEWNATEIPADFPVTAASRMIDYDWTEINGEKYLLPSFSDVRLTARESRELYESRNQIRFRDYNKYGTEVKILDDDEIVDETPEPTKKP